MRRLCCPAAVRGARPKQEPGKIDCADSASWTHRSFFNRSVATGKPGRPGPRGEPSQKIRHGGCVLLAKDEGDGCKVCAFLRGGLSPLASARERAEFFWIFARWVRKGKKPAIPKHNPIFQPQWMRHGVILRRVPSGKCGRKAGRCFDLQYVSHY